MNYKSYLDFQRNGWCVSIDAQLGSDTTIGIYHSGPFESEGLADSDAKRLNDIESARAV